MNDKLLEKNRYNNKAENILSNIDATHDFVRGPIYLAEPYIMYERVINEQHLYTTNKSSVLEIGAGTGLMSEPLLNKFPTVYVIDISIASLIVFKRRFTHYNNFSCQVADLEFLPFVDQSFDFVFSAGVLSYGDNDRVMREIHRVLKTGGKYICVDSLNNNPIYRLNRWLHFLKGSRSKSTLARMPSLKMLEDYKEFFGLAKIYYFGSISWMMPLVAWATSQNFAFYLSHRFDKLINCRSSAFKFIMIAEKR